MEVGRYAWICARACVGPGVNVGEGAVLGLSSVATRDLEPWGVYAGSPAVKVKERKRVHEGEAWFREHPLKANRFPKGNPRGLSVWRAWVMLL
jgi:serine acetyltransferase